MRSVWRLDWTWSRSSTRWTRTRAGRCPSADAPGSARTARSCNPCPRQSHSGLPGSGERQRDRRAMEPPSAKDGISIKGGEEGVYRGHGVPQLWRCHETEARWSCETVLRARAPELHSGRNTGMQMVCPDEVILEFVTLKWTRRPEGCGPADETIPAVVPVGNDPRSQVAGLTDVEQCRISRCHQAVEATFNGRACVIDWHVLGPWQAAPDGSYWFPSWPNRMGSWATIGVCGAVGKQVTTHTPGLHPGFGVVGMEPPMIRPG